LAEKEENLITIFKTIETELTKIREIMETMNLVNYEIATQLPTIMYQILNDYSSKIDEALKLFQWYAEKQTGRKYTKET